MLTPLPGSEDHQTLWKKGVEMDADLNIYDVEHVCTAHSKMSKQEWESIYQEAWSLYYSPEHMKTLLRRAVATGVPLASLVKMLVSFATTVPLENVHPLQSGLLRLKHPSERRPDLPKESAVTFWPRFIWETVTKHLSLGATIAGLATSAFFIARDKNSKSYMDQALTPVGDHEDETLELFTKTAGGRAAVSHIHRVAELTHAHKAV